MLPKLSPRATAAGDGAAAAVTYGDSPAEQLLRIGLALTIGAVVVQSVAHLVNLWAFDLDADVVSADSDTSAFAWMSVVTTFTAAVGAVLHYAVRGSESLRLAFLAIAIAFLSFDDLLEVHERLSSLVTKLGADEDWHLARLFWPAVFFPLLLATFWLLWELARTLPERFRRVLLFGASLLVVAIGLEIVSPALFWAGFDHGDLVYELEVVAEEGAELAGWALIATALIASALAIVETVPGR